MTMSDNSKKDKIDRRKFLVYAGRTACALAIGGVATRVIGAHLSEDNQAPRSRYVWAIDDQKCTACGICETACVRKPSAVKAVNDQKKCSFCVVCHGHISNTRVPIERIMSDGIRICKHDAVIRTSFTGTYDGYFKYEIDDRKCTGCGDCVRRCNEHGSHSMFLIIRPDLCLNCNNCTIAAKCPEKAIQKVYIGPEDDYRGVYEIESQW